MSVKKLKTQIKEAKHPIITYQEIEEIFDHLDEEDLIDIFGFVKAVTRTDTNEIC